MFTKAILIVFETIIVDAFEMIFNDWSDFFTFNVANLNFQCEYYLRLQQPHIYLMITFFLLASYKIL